MSGAIVNIALSDSVSSLSCLHLIFFIVPSSHLLYHAFISSSLSCLHLIFFIMPSSHLQAQFSGMPSFHVSLYVTRENIGVHKKPAIHIESNSYFYFALLNRVIFQTTHARAMWLFLPVERLSKSTLTGFSISTASIFLRPIFCRFSLLPVLMHQSFSLYFQFLTSVAF